MMPRLPRAALAFPATIFLLAACSSTASPTPTESVAVVTPSPTGTADQSGIDAWSVNATQLRGMDGEQFEFDCPPGGELDDVWGTDVYTDDSSICSAGVHAGVITLEEPGPVVIEIRPGEDAYEGTERNGVTSLSYPAWGGSYVIIDD